MSFTWQATYNDGSIIKQIADDGVEKSSDSIDRNRVVEMSLLRDGTPVATLFLDRGQKLVYRRRVAITGDKQTVCHIMGWRQRVGPEVVQSMAYYFEDGRVEMAGQFRENHPWFYPVVLREFEA